MSRDLLQSLGLDLPLLATTSVGSFPKPTWLMNARSKHRRGELSDDQLRAKEDKALEWWIRKQETLGIDILVDGEQYRGDMVAYFAETMGGFQEGGLVRSYGNRYYHKPVVVDEIRWKAPITIARWKQAQALTKKPMKGMLTGPYTIMDWSFNEYYPDRRAVAFAIAREMRKEVEALIEAGCKIIQVDEPALSVRADELDVAYEAVQIVTENQKAYFINHVCYGEFDKIYPDMLRMPVHNLDLEMSNSELALLDLFKKDPFTKDLSFGVVDVHTHAIEDAVVVQERLRAALEVLKPEQVWVGPDCGLKTRTVDEAVDKLKVCVEAAKALRGELAKVK